MIKAITQISAPSLILRGYGIPALSTVGLGRTTQVYVKIVAREAQVSQDLVPLMACALAYHLYEFASTQTLCHPAVVCNPIPTKTTLTG